MPTRLRRRQSLVLLGALLISSACSPRARDLPPEMAEGATASYRLAVGDRLRIAVFGHSEHTGEFQIDSAGNINFPLLGEVKAEGRTITELKKKLRNDLNANYLVDPRISVEVLNYRPFFILGEVNNPGKYSYEPGLSVRQAIALAGGFTRRAATQTAMLRRPTKKGMAEFTVPLNTKIRPGDTIEVQRRFF